MYFIKKIITILIFSLFILAVFIVNEDESTTTMICTRGSLEKTNSYEEFKFNYIDNELLKFEMNNEIYSDGNEGYDLNALELYYKEQSEKYLEEKGIKISFSSTDNILYVKKEMMFSEDNVDYIRDSQLVYRFFDPYAPEMKDIKLMKTIMHKHGFTCN